MVYLKDEATRGLLRWKLETEEGDCEEDKVYGVEEWVTRVTGTWLKERS